MEYSEIMANQSNMNPEQFSHYREVASRLGIATPLFLPKNIQGGFNTSRSLLHGGNISTNMSGIGAVGASVSRSNIPAMPSNVGSGAPYNVGNESIFDYT